jgi:hypothetical protein
MQSTLRPPFGATQEKDAEVCVHSDALFPSVSVGVAPILVRERQSESNRPKYRLPSIVARIQEREPGQSCRILSSSGFPISDDDTQKVESTYAMI